MASAGGAEGVWQASQQPQYLAVADNNGQQQIVQVVGREGGGQMLVQVPPEQIQGQSGGQLVVAAPQQGTGQVVLDQQGAGQVILAAPQGNQVVGQAGGQVVFAASTARGQGNQVVVAQQPVAQQAGQMVLATPQGNQMVIGQGQGGQMVLVAPQGGGQVAQAQPSGQVVMATPGVAGASQSPGQVIVGQTGSSEGGVMGVATAENVSQDIIKGGQLVQLAEQDQYGILSSDGTKLVLAESKEAAIAALQAAASAPPTSSRPQGVISRPLSASPAPPTLAAQSQSLLIQQQQGYSVKIKKEPQSPDMQVGTSYFSPPSMTPPLSGKATPTTVGQSTASAETIDPTRQTSNQEVS